MIATDFLRDISGFDNRAVQQSYAIEFQSCRINLHSSRKLYFNKYNPHHLLPLWRTTWPKNCKNQKISSKKQLEKKNMKTFFEIYYFQTRMFCRFGAVLCFAAGVVLIYDWKNFQSNYISRYHKQYLDQMLASGIFAILTSVVFVIEMCLLKKEE